MTEKNIPAFKITRIKQFSFLTNESLAEVGKPVRIQFQHNTTYHGYNNMVDLTLRVYYSYDTRIPPDSILVDFHVQNLFEVLDLKQYQSDSSEYILPKNLIVAMLGVSISHLRALMAYNIAGTAYQDNLIPIVDPVEVAKSFYPNMFAKKENDADLKSFKKATQDLNKAINKTKDQKRSSSNSKK